MKASAGGETTVDGGVGALVDGGAFTEFKPEYGTTLVTEVFDYRPSPIAGLLERMKVPARNANSIRATLGRLQQRFS